VSPSTHGKAATTASPLNNFFGCCPTNRRQHDTSAGFSFGNEVPPIVVRSGGRLVLDSTLAMGFHTCWHSWWTGGEGLMQVLSLLVSLNL